MNELLENPILSFGGVANRCTVWLNGKKLGSHEGMFGGPDFAVKKYLKKENTLVVKLDPIPQMFLGNWPPTLMKVGSIPWCLIVFMVGTMLKFRHWEFGVR